MHLWGFFFKEYLQVQRYSWNGTDLYLERAPDWKSFVKKLNEHHTFEAFAFLVHCRVF